MRGIYFIAGAVVGALGIGIAAYRTDFTSVEKGASELASSIKAKVTGDEPPTPAAAPVAPEPYRFSGPVEIRLSEPTEARVSYGKLRLPAGTTLRVLREAKEGFAATYQGADILLPPSVIHRPATPAPLAPPPPAAGKAVEVATTAAGPSAGGAAPTPNQVATVAHFSPYLLLVDGDQSKGSGAIVQLHGKAMVVTNAHVVDGNKRVTFRRLNNDEVHFSDLSLSKECDLAIASQTAVAEGIPALENVDANAAVGDEVVVLGNSLGSDVVTEIPGKITGIGPSLVEVDAKFVHGNSGSPIIHVKSGKLVAIATFATVRKLSSLDKDSNFAEIRRFGYRVDSARDWETPHWSTFVQEAETLKRVSRETDAMVGLAKDIYSNGKITLGLHQAPDNPVRPYVNDYMRVVNSPTTTSRIDVTSAKQKLFRGLIFLTKKDVEGGSYSTSWHRRILNEETEDREYLRGKFVELANLQDATKQIRLP